jgi:tetratricopeptide (TPR) repeat protein
MRSFLRFILLIITLPAALLVQSQPKLEFELKKPKQFEERKLPSERLAEKKFTKMRRFFQNTYTHYNYFFNANLKLNEIIEESKNQSKDDFTKLLPFFPYSLDATSKSGFLDSVLQKCTAGILLHDLRNDWIDNLYLVMGKAYLLRKNFDSAAMTFQYINTSFSPKEKDGYDKVIGSNAEEGGSAMSVATKEKKGTFAYLLSRPPSRNESFVWQIRTLTEDSNFIDASSLIETLRNDPLFPDRLKEELAESRAYLYYKMEMWDSAAAYLVKAIPLAPSRGDKARDWYLAGQLYQLANDAKNASDAFEKCTSLALDPVMEVYARLNSIRLNKGNDPKIIDQNVASLVSMARKDKYQNYRDIIYYAAGLFEMERDGYDAAKVFLNKSIQYNTTDAAQRNRSFMLLGDVDFQRKAYGNASLGYDSVMPAGLADEAALRLTQRKPGTHQIYVAEQLIFLQDSLLQLAALDEHLREAAVKKIAKEQRKLRGLKEEVSTGSVGAGATANPASPLATAASSLFSSTPGTWYFYDVSIRANGYSKFRERWGGRPNVDNWRRSASIKTNVPTLPTSDDPLAKGDVLPGDDEAFDTTDVSYDNLYSRIPLTEERQKRANDRITNALYSKGEALHVQLEDYPEAIKVFEEILKRSSDTSSLAEKSLFALIHCYSQVGDLANANRCKQLLQKQFSGSDLIAKLNKSTSAKEEGKTTESTNTYKKIYDLFIEGNFDKAVAEKRIADSSIGKNYWTPQLLYLESVYYIKQREDSLAIKSLKNISTEFGSHPLSGKATKMIEVLGRRKEIEDYLTKLQITRAEEDNTAPFIPSPLNNVLYPTSDKKMDSAFKTIELPVANKKNDSSKTADISVPTIPADSTGKILVTNTPKTVSPYTIHAAEPGMVAIVLEKVDPAYVNEVMYSFNSSSRRHFNGIQVDASKKKLKDNLWVVMLKSEEFKNVQAMVDYINYIKPVAQKDIISWLDSSKYYYTVISEENLNLLQLDPNIGLYQQVLKETFPGKF